MVSEPWIRSEARRLFELAAPAIVAQLGWMMLGVVDVLMLGSFSVEALDSAQLGRLWVMGTTLMGWGLLLGLDPIVSQAHGAGDSEHTGLALQQGLLVALLVSIPIGFSWLWTAEGLVFLGQDPEFAATGERYARAQWFGLPCVLMFTALRQYLQGRGIVRPAMWVILAANLVNVGCNYLLIFGHWGFPRLGAVGAGWATAITQVFLVLALAGMVVIGRLHEGGWTGWSRAALRLSGLARLIRIGTPVGVMFTLEIWAFAASSLIAGKLGEHPLAAHTIAMNLASLSAMVPLGLSMGTSVRVGHLLGAGQPRQAQRAAWLSCALAAGLMGAAAITFLLGRRALPALYTDESHVLAMAAGVLPIAAAFQLFDGVQMIGGGVLRGMGKALPATGFNLVGYYLLALPLGHYLTFQAGWGLPGLWWGLCIGLAVVSALFVGWIAYRGPQHASALPRDEDGAAPPRSEP